MALTDVHKTVIQIVNEVQRRLGLSASADLSSNHSQVLLELLNDVIDEVSDFGPWPQMYREVWVTSQSSVGQYEIVASAQVQNVAEIVWTEDIAPLEVRTIEDLRRLQRLASFGKPRQFAIVGVSGVNPLFRVYPVPTTTKSSAFNIWYYKKLRLLTTSDTNTTVPFPAKLLTQGLYAKAVMEEAGGEPTNQYQLAFAEYNRLKQEATNRLQADTGTDIYFAPTGSRYA